MVTEFAQTVDIARFTLPCGDPQIRQSCKITAILYTGKSSVVNENKVVEIVFFSVTYRGIDQISNGVERCSFYYIKT